MKHFKEKNFFESLTKCVGQQLHSKNSHSIVKVFKNIKAELNKMK